jgi:hypothetical protein
MVQVDFFYGFHGIREICIQFLFGEIHIWFGRPGEILFWPLRLQKIFNLFFDLENCEHFFVWFG